MLAVPRLLGFVGFSIYPTFSRGSGESPENVDGFGGLSKSGAGGVSLYHIKGVTLIAVNRGAS